MEEYRRDYQHKFYLGRLISLLLLHFLFLISSAAHPSGHKDEHITKPISRY